MADTTGVTTSPVMDELLDQGHAFSFVQVRLKQVAKYKILGTLGNPNLFSNEPLSRFSRIMLVLKGHKC